MRLLLIILVSLLGIQSYACDICGCSARSTSLGLLPGEGVHFLGLRYNYRQFYGIHPPVGLDPGGQKTHDQFHTTELWGRYAPLPRFQIFAFVPVRYSVQEEQATEDTKNIRRENKGVGDVSVILSGVIVHSVGSSTGGKALHDWSMGVGIKAPTGKSREIDPAMGAVLPNMQAGTGSWDFSLISNYRFSLNDWGINTNASYRYNSANKYRYRFGNRLMISTQAFRAIKIPKKNMSIVPQAGFSFENAQQDVQNLSKHEMNEYSGGNFLNGQISSDFYIKNIGLSIGLEIPIVQNYAQGYINNRFALDAGVKILFKQNSKKIQNEKE